MITLEELVGGIKSADWKAEKNTRKYLDTIAKPLNSLGELENILVKLGGIGALKASYKPAVVVMCADNGVVKQGVTQTGSEVTAVVAGNMTKGESTVCIMAETVGGKVFPYDCGMLTEVSGVENIKVMNGTRDFSEGPAMTRQQAIETVLRGAQVAIDIYNQGYDIFCVGEMGIGNTTSSAAVTAVLTGARVSDVTGKGAGLSDEGLERKIKVIEKAISINKPDREDAIDVLAKVGGLDIAGMAGVFLGCAYSGVPVIIDGFISSVAALIAVRLAPESLFYMIPSHMSKEPGAVKVMRELRMQPLFSMGMALGEGTGAVTMLPLINMAAAVYAKMPTFQDIGVEAYKPQ